jgi:UDP:flavonoid glycosyltransferase YjiC (YdhE family)
MSRIVLATAGSLGDLHPYLAVGIELKARGHDVVIATMESYRRKIQDENLGFAPVRPDIAPQEYSPEVYRKANDLRTGSTYMVREMVLPFVGEMYADLLEACRGADLLVIHPVLFAAPLVAEKLNLRWISVTLAPGSFFSAYDPPVMPPFPALHSLRHLGPWPSKWVFDLFRRLTRSWMKPIDDLRKSEGLAPAVLHPLHNGMYSPYGTLGLFSPIFGAPQPDWPVNTKATGFPFYDRLEAGHAMAPGLAEFCERGAPPVIFTLGSSAVMDPGDFYNTSLEAAKKLGCRAVLLTGAFGNTRLRETLPQNIYVADYAPYSELFPKASVIVHQGGVGTTAQAIHAGVPMLVIPFMHDQPDNAFRVKRLGIGRTIHRDRYTVERAAANLRALLENPEFGRRAREIGEQIRKEDGLKLACDALEKHASG